MRRAKIICTLGPKTETLENIQKLADSGMNIARINMSHGDSEWNSKIVKRVKKVSRKGLFPISMMLDTQVPEIRTSNTEFGLEEGDLFKIAVNSACDIDEGEKHTFVDHKNLTSKIKKKDIILIDDGMIALEVLKVDMHHIKCKVLNKGKLGSRKSVNIPGIKLDLPALSKKDKEDIKLGARLGIEYIAQSFVRNKKDVLEMKKFLKSIRLKAIIIAKIEDKEGIDNIDSIIDEADSIMVARGDMGVEVGFEKIPLIQRMIVRKCIAAGKPVIIATHLLESMIYNPRPTRAEVTDVANAIFEKADCIMLSGETTKGKYPFQCVKTMHSIAKSVQTRLRFEYKESKTKNVKEAICLGACANAENLDAKAIIVFSKTGKLLSLVTKNRPNVDIFAFTDSNQVRKKMILYWNTFPFKISFDERFKIMVENAIKTLKKNKFVSKGDRVVIVSDISPKKNIDIMEIRGID